MTLLLAALLVFFSPNGGTQAEIVKQISQSKTSVWVQAYSFTAMPIEAELESAKKRGEDVRVILDRSWQNQSPKVEAQLVSAAIPVLIDSRHAIAHNKIIIIDGKKVLTGSYNFTNQAEHANAENLIEFTYPKIVAAYVANWKAHAAHSLAP